MTEGKGISFMMRIRDEEATLEKSVRSLSELSIPHEIVIVLHCCTDRSKEIAEMLQGERPDTIKIFQYDNEISRAGYELLATDAESLHSFVQYSNWCLSKCTKPWIFKWDGDFIATPELISYLNAGDWTPRIERHYFAACNSTSANREPYLHGGLTKYTKFVFWEVPNTNSTPVDIHTGVNLIHASELSSIKNYWYNEPWYTKEDTVEAQQVRDRIKTLTDLFGPEPPGFARGSNDSELMYRSFTSIRANPPDGINPYN